MDSERRDNDVVCDVWAVLHLFTKDPAGRLVLNRRSLKSPHTIDHPMRAFELLPLSFVERDPQEVEEYVRRKFKMQATGP